MIELDGKVALVTGASRGIGRACALRLAESGCHLIVNYLTSHSAAREVAKEIQALGRRVAIVKADVSESEDVQAMAEFITDRFGKLDILVSNVASGGFRPLLQTTPQHFNSTMNINVMATLALVQSCLPLLQRAEGRAKVIAMSSHGSQLALPDYGMIGTSKAALESLMRHLALELGQKINFNVVLAGLVATDSTRGLPGSEALFAQAESAMMVKDRTLTATDVANSVLFLSSALSDLVQAQTLVVDGGAGKSA